LTVHLLKAAVALFEVLMIVGGIFLSSNASSDLASLAICQSRSPSIA
jgi:hypothetical protein